MSLKDTYKHLKDLLANITVDLDKSENGNKAASQRVRTGTVKLEKVAKAFRKESILHEKKTKGQKKTTKSASKAPAKAAKPAAKTAAKPVAKPVAKAKAAAPVKKAVVKAKPKATQVKPRQFSLKKATAKLPAKKR